jgi:predicted peptidase
MRHYVRYVRFKPLWSAVAALVIAIGFGFGMMTFGNPESVQDIFNRDVIEVPRTGEPVGQAGPFYERKEIGIQEENRKHLFTYFWMEPHKPYPEGLKFPLVVVLHDAPGKAYAGEHLAQSEMQIAYPSFVMVPVIPAGSLWAFPASLPPGYEHMEPLVGTRQMLPYVVTMVRNAMAQYPIDPSRVYIMGCSYGGFGAFGAARDYPDLFAAAISISGGWSAEDTPRLNKIPLWAIHGRRDENVPVSFSRDVAELIAQYGGLVHYTEIPDMGYDCRAPQLYGKAIWEWLFRQKKEISGKK